MEIHFCHPTDYISSITFCCLPSIATFFLSEVLSQFFLFVWNKMFPREYSFVQIQHHLVTSERCSSIILLFRTENCLYVNKEVET